MEASLLEDTDMKRSQARIIREYGPFENVSAVHGLTYDGSQVWFAVGDRLLAMDPDSGATTRAIDVAASAGTAYDGRHLYQIADGRIQKIEPASGRVVSTIAAPGGGEDSGLAWAEGSLWVGVYRQRKIHQVDPESGRVLRTIASDRYVTGVTWVDGKLWHGTWEDGASELRELDARTGEVLQSVEMPAGTGVSGLESDAGERLFCGGGDSGKVRVVQRP